MATIKNLPKSKIDNILIRNVPGYSLVREFPLTDVVRSFDNFFQAALLFAASGLIDPAHVWNLSRSFHNHYGLTLSQVAGTLAGLAQAPEIAVDLKRAAQEALEKTQTTPDPEALKAMKSSLAIPPQNLSGMSEPEILQHARAWMQKMRRERE